MKYSHRIHFRISRVEMVASRAWDTYKTFVRQDKREVNNLGQNLQSSFHPHSIHVFQNQHFFEIRMFLGTKMNFRTKMFSGPTFFWPFFGGSRIDQLGQFLGNKPGGASVKLLFLL